LNTGRGASSISGVGGDAPRVRAATSGEKEAAPKGDTGLAGNTGDVGLIGATVLDGDTWNWGG